MRNASPGAGARRTLQSECLWLLSFSPPILVTDVASGEKSFFKAHVDTPRGERMFGSLVVFFPTKYEGGSLIMRQKGEQWSFDAANALAEAKDPQVAYVALYSDVEHEVSTVTSGYRVTSMMTLQFLHPCLPPLLRSRTNLRPSSLMRHFFLMAECLALTWNATIQYKILSAHSSIWASLKTASKEPRQRSWQLQRNFRFMSRLGVDYP